MTASKEMNLVERAINGDQSAFEHLLTEFRQQLFSYIYRMVAHLQNAEDLMQDVLLRAMQSLPQYRREARFKTWLFGIATHVCLDHLRQKKRWSVEAQLKGEQETDKDPDAVAGLRSLLGQQDFVYEIREHIAFCFSCIGRTLAPEEQAAIMLKEVLGFTAQEAAQIIGVSEPIFRHSLSSARSTMIGHYNGLCQLINKTGVCYQCSGLREVTPENNRGEDLVQIQVAPNLSVTPENLFDSRLNIVREADLAFGKTRAMHHLFYEILTPIEEQSA
jgi:RNA polymerase sigma-70 factor (ECF subfamily)